MWPTFCGAFNECAVFVNYSLNKHLFVCPVGMLFPEQLLYIPIADQKYLAGPVHLICRHDRAQCCHRCP